MRFRDHVSVFLLTLLMLFGFLLVALAFIGVFVG